MIKYGDKTYDVSIRWALWEVAASKMVIRRLLLLSISLELFYNIYLLELFNYLRRFGDNTEITSVDKYKTKKLGEFIVFVNPDEN